MYTFVEDALGCLVWAILYSLIPWEDGGLWPLPAVAVGLAAAWVV